MKGKFLITILWLISHANCFKEYNGRPNLLSEEINEMLEIGLSKTYTIEYKKDTNITFNIPEETNCQVNIHSSDCNFKIDFEGEVMNQINLNTYSLRMNNIIKSVIIQPLKDIIDGEEKENYALKKCHLSINSINEEQLEMKIENKDDTFIFFKSQEFKSLNISYKINEISNTSFAAFFFQFHEKSNFSINIISVNRNIISRYIYNSTYLFLDSEILQKAVINNAPNLNLSIIIEKMDYNKNITMRFKIIEKEMISMIKKNALNYGFITTNTFYHYYYMEVFKGEEGQILLHNKRFYGRLIGKIVNKTDFNENDLNDTSKYPTDSSNDTHYLNYLPHSFRLKYEYENTISCDEGCYILITYKQKESQRNYPRMGYEFTLISRSWNYFDYIPQIVDLPFNEYILGVFETDSITNHYYSISIPNDAEKIIIQMEGNYIDCFYGEGRKKINTIKIKGNDKNLEIIDKQNVIILNIEELHFKEKTISFAFRPKDYFSNIFSFYYFRILYSRTNEKLYLPIDSTLGNLCFPEYNNQTNLFYCNLMFSNKYNELNTNFSMSSNLDDYLKIYATKIYKNGSIENEASEIFFVYYAPNNQDDTNNGIDCIFFTFEFRNSKIKDITSSLVDSITDYYPQIYSSQMFYNIGFYKKCLYNVSNNYTLIYKFINGTDYYNGWVDINFLNYKTFFANRNFRGKPYAFDIDSETTEIVHRVSEGGEYLIIIKLEYIMRNKGIIEIQSGETRSQIMKSGSFPLYYYLRLKDKDYVNIDVNLRLNSFDDSVMKNNFDILGYLLDEDTIKRKINGEYIQLSNPINGIYSNKFKLGLLEVNKKKTQDNSNNYLLIEIRNMDTARINSYLLVELVTREYNQEIYFLPINQYIFETFDGDNDQIREYNKYNIFVSMRIKDHVMIELSPEYDDIELQFTDITDPEIFNYSVKSVTGFKKYRISETNNDSVYFKVVNPNKRKANYMLRFYYSTEVKENHYFFNDKPILEYSHKNDENITVSLTFEQILIKNISQLPIQPTYDTYFYITGLLYKKNISSEELINTTSLLYERPALYESETIINFYSLKNPEKFTLTFKNISRKNNFKYEVQLQINVFILENLLNEEFLIFTTEIDLTDIKKEEEEKSNVLVIVFSIIGGIVILGGGFLLYKYLRLRHANRNLSEEIKSIAYSNEIHKNVIKKEEKSSKKESDYDSTFI